MTMVERRKFRRRNRNPIDDGPEEPPIEPLESRDRRLERRRAEDKAALAEETAHAAEEAARRSAEEEARQRAAEEARLQEQREAEAREEARRQTTAKREEIRKRLRVHDGDKVTAPATASAPVEAETAPAQAPRSPARKPTPLWHRLQEFTVNPRHLERHRIITAERQDPAHAAFDVLRTRLLQALAERGWTRVAITSPTKDCGKTFTAANLAISLSRQQNCRTMLIDCDLRRPSLHKVLGVKNPGSMGDVLRGLVPPEDHLIRMGENEIHAGRNIAFGFNGTVEPYASELLQSPQSRTALRHIEDEFAPDVMLFDLPPALYYDDVMAFRGQFDGVILVIGGGITTEKEIRETQRRLGDDVPLLGTVLNKAEGSKIRQYTY
ncbi:CpsD/CapB family tyrosine-protein kinase [Salipiger bermudensis]|uniref:CpsD/CapB family tyrosine-protein kinase n=1 Tax=Salipiger bermudensis TaxID=344736 RepID=UPI001A8F2545|nr:CpsD/CapB family tyrosine-protein kinase [Salipiger bermudensis]MBN9677152.1 CpsD/CapB family tyrosine-protein kinase [Salipiger bermudensis]MBR9890185.1 CpsD/CapB family tyrosine-protein kinase [bacterium]